MIRIVAVALSLAACGKGNPSEPVPTPVPAPSPKIPVDGLELVSNGSEPRRLLRYTPKKGTMTVLELAQDSNVVSQGRTARLPTLVLTTEVWIDDVASDGSAKVRTKVVGVAARERKDQTMTAAKFGELAQMFDGTTTRYTVSPSGNVTGTAVEAGRDVPAAVGEQIDNVGKNFERCAMALPEVPVGPGAVWRFRKTISQIGIPSTVVTTVELIAIDGDRITVKASSKASGENQKLTQPNGSAVDVRDVSGGGPLSATYDLARVVINGEATLDFNAVMDGLELKMSSASKMTVKPN